MKLLQDKVAIITGSGRGIGAATAQRMADEGAIVIIGDIMGDMAEETATQISQSGGTVIGCHLDGTDAWRVAMRENLTQALLAVLTDEHGA